MWVKRILLLCIISFISLILCSSLLISGYEIQEKLYDKPELEEVRATVSANKQNFKKGEEVVVTCRCNGSSHITVDWGYMNQKGKITNGTRVLTSESIHRISDTETEFEARYKILESSIIICECQGIKDYATSIVSVYVTELNDPVEIFAPIDQPLEQESFEMICAADSANFSETAWYKDNVLLEADNTKTVYTNLSNNSVMRVLKFNWITKNDTGMYECQALEKSPFFSDSDEVKMVNIQRVVKYIDVGERPPENINEEVFENFNTKSVEIFANSPRFIAQFEEDIKKIVEKSHFDIIIACIILGIVIVCIAIAIAYCLKIRQQKRNQDKIYEMQVLKNNERTQSFAEQGTADPSYRPLISPTPDIIQIHQNPFSRNKSEENTLLANFISAQRSAPIERFPVIPEQSALEMPRSRTGIYETDQDPTSSPLIRLSQILDQAVEMGNQETTEEEYIPIRKVRLPRSLSYIRRSAEILKKRARSFHLQGEVLDEFMAICQEYEFPATSLKFTKNLGVGAFGIVRHAFAYGLVPNEEKTEVAVKSIKNNHKHGKDALLSEIKIMVHIGQHLNVVNLMGIVTENISKGDFMIMVEYCSRGNIREFLKNNRHNFVNEINPETNSIDSVSHHIVLREQRTLTTSHLLSWSFQVARGMDFLSSKRVIHGDLAARNILLCHDNFVKICDFGLARFKQESNYYRKRTSGLIPVKWIALESFNANIFSTYSDVWSFGVVLWELFSLGEEPYPETELSQVYTKLLEGYRMQKPRYSTEDLYQIMIRCWMENTKARPSFAELETILGEMLNLRIRDYVVSSNEPYLIMNREVEKYQQNTNYHELICDASQNYQNL